ncbi:MAG: hypothetical protein ACI9K1_000662 [Arcticibacterium sp.]|jgi:hypothetical protein
MGTVRKVLFTLLYFISTIIYAQDLDITFPSERAIFQRNNGNATIVFIAGNYRTRLDKIEAKLIPIQGGTPVDWTPIVAQPFFGTYRGSLVVNGGWYELHVRGIRNNKVVAESILPKFGVGEVFLISGQSNAQGYNGRGQRGAYDDRVNVISNFKSEGFAKPVYPTFGHLDAESNIAPTGNGAWYWGELGDLLTDRLNVPILFMNAAWEGFQVHEFIKSSKGESGINPYSYNQAPPGYPFGSVVDALNYYTNLTGLRSILWHQGESDNFLNTSFESYSSDLSQIINETNNRTGKNISWMVARVSKNQDRFYPTIVDAQNFVIGGNANVFPGPNTDLVLDRLDGVHFSPTGFTEVAEQWNQQMNANFFNSSNPQYGNPPMQLESYCINENQGKPMRLSAPQGYVSYKWNNSLPERSLEAGPGYHQVEALDVFGNVYYSPPIKYDNSLIPQKPNIEALGPTEFCNGNSVELKSNKESYNYWSNGAEGGSITVNSPGLYHLYSVNLYICGAKSDDIEIRTLPTPIPEIIASGPLDICSDKELTLSTNLNDAIFWSNGSTEPNLKVTGPGNFFVKVKNEFGCEGQSKELSVTIKPAAFRPLIENLGNTILCKNDSTILRASNDQNLIWNTGTDLKDLIVKSTGEYFAINRNEFGCTSSSEKLNIKFNPIPPKPEILTEGSLEVCDDEEIVLKASPAYSYSWSTGHTTEQITIKNTREVFLKTRNELGCLSEASDLKKIIVLVKPKNPMIVQSGTFTLKSYFTTDTTDLEYQWRIEDKQIVSPKPFIKVIKTGDYVVQGIKNYRLKNGQNKVCISQESESFNYYLNTEQQGFSYYPNPAPDKKITIETLEDIDRATVTIFDLKGVPYLTEYVELFDSPKTFNLEKLPKGRYLLKVRNSRSSFSGKLMVE